MASVKVKFRPSTIEGKTGALYFQVIHRRIVRSQKTKYKIYPDEWNARTYNPQIEMFARFKMKSSFHKTKRII